jgi:hypothetical protein
MSDDLSGEEWAEELQYALATGPGALEMMTVATYETAAAVAVAEVIETARNVVAASGLPIIELDARTVTADPDLLPSNAGYVILHHVELPLSGAIPVLIGGFQHLVARGLMVGMLVLGSSADIKALRRKDLGLINRAEVLNLR